jgi:TonB family protein
MPRRAMFDSRHVRLFPSPVAASLRRHAFSLLGLLVLSAAPALAQNAPPPLAQEIVKRINKLRGSSKKKNSTTFRIAVIPFSRQDGETTQLGVELAHQLAGEIASSAPDLEFASEDELLNGLERESLRWNALNDDYVSWWFARKQKLNFVLSGNFAPKDTGLELRISGVSPKTDEKVGHFRAAYSGSDELRRRITEDKPLLSAGEPVARKAGTGGVGEPTCLSCPDPHFTNEARAAKFEGGNVVLKLIVTTDGRPTKIGVSKGLPYGLTLAAIQSVQRWTFKPAKDSNGNPVPVWVIVEVTFKLV